MHVRSFSAASTPIFAAKYSSCSIFRDLENELAEFSEFAKNFRKIENRKFKKILQKSENFPEILQNFSLNLQKFAKIWKIDPFLPKPKLNNEYFFAF